MPLRPDRAPPRRPRLLTRGVALGALALLAACGGGGGGSGSPVDVQTAGIWGSVRLPDQHLGRIAEREPNDSAAQPYRLPPAAARTTLEVAGNLDATGGWYGVEDGRDVLRFRALADSDVLMRLEHRTVDPLGGGLNLVSLEVRAADGTLIDDAVGAAPLEVTAPVAGETTVDVVVTCISGATPYVLRFEVSDASVPPPAPKRAPGAPASRAVAAAPAPTPPPLAASEAHVLVRLKEGVDAAAWAARHGHALGAATATGTCRVLLAPRGEARPGGAQKAAKGFAADPDVAWSEPDWRVEAQGWTADARASAQWNLRALGAPEAWAITQGSPDVVVGVLDTGITDHPDFEGQVVPGYDFVSDPGLAADGGGRDPDPTDPGDHDATNGTSLWHGSHVAGAIAARADAEGTVGLAPGCRLMPLRVLGRAGGLVGDVADALLFAAGLFTTEDGRRLAAPLRVVNLSLGTSVFSAELEAACAAAAAQGVLVVASSGNTGGAVLFPGAHDGVLAVSAVDALLRGTGYSSRGAQIALCAPGGFSLQDVDGDGWPDGVLGCGRDETRFPAPVAHTWLTGTSVAAPHVAASAALLLSYDPSLTAAQVRARLEQSALDVGLDGRDDLHGWGVVQPAIALKRLVLDRGGTLPGPRLHLPVPGLRVVGLESQRTLPLRNVGGGTLTLVGAHAVTDDGGDWLGSAFVESFPGDDVTASKLDVLVDRTRLPQGTTWTSGTIRLYSASGPMGLVRVVVAANNSWPRAGSPLRVVPIDVDDGGAPTTTLAHPENDYRYVLGKLGAATYNVRAGEDLDGDGFACEPFDVCGWYGGLLQAEALPVVTGQGLVVEAIDVTIGLAPPP